MEMRLAARFHRPQKKKPAAMRVFSFWAARLSASVARLAGA
ncbi:hypothetical protein [Paraburkholderia tropica]|nr:hypothetical protein [Paraburkholderia tropica]